VKKNNKKKQPHPKPAQPDRLISKLEDVEQALQSWIRTSAENGRLFRRDPIAAMRSAGLNIEDEILLELEQITSAIAKKLK
jgi:hypothetical protein